MRFLVYAQLPPLLARHLAGLGHQTEHVFDLGLASASDRDIWNLAVSTGAALITKDEDFVTMRALNTDGPPIVWVRIRNTTRRDLVSRFSAAQQAVFAALERGESVIEVSE